MLQNAYLVAKIGADTAENEQHFAEILPITANFAAARRRHEWTATYWRKYGAAREAAAARPRRKMGNDMSRAEVPVGAIDSTPLLKICEPSFISLKRCTACVDCSAVPKPASASRYSFCSTN